MTPPRAPFRSERLRESHELDSFRCGSPALDRWLVERARRGDAMGTSRTYVWTDRVGEVVAYYALTLHVVRSGDIPRRIAHGAPDEIPAILLARMALDQRIQGQGRGGEVLADALRTALDAMRRAGGRLVVVDAIDERAARFYQRFGFVPTDRDDRRLVMKASDAARWVGAPWP